MKLFLFYLSFLFSFSGMTQVTIKINSFPANTPSGNTIYFAGNINNWNPGNAKYTCPPDSNGIPTIVIHQGTGEVQFKFTRGTWDNAEGGANGEEIDNRSFTFSDVPQTINLIIQSWKNKSSSTAATNVRILDTAFYMPQLDRTRRIWLYLPPDYNTTTKKYPVIYMHDGQNLFDKATSFSEEWQVDETLNNLHAEGDYGVIVVGIDNGGEQRINEYSPWVNPKYGGGQGDAYIDFIAQALKPFIDSNFRTKPDAFSTALFGSSMGGYISLYGTLKYPDVFGKAGSFSPSYWFAFSSLTQYILNNPNSISSLRIQHTAGQNESNGLVSEINKVTNILFPKGLQQSNSVIKIDVDGEHNEIYWRREFGQAYQWLFQ